MHGALQYFHLSVRTILKLENGFQYRRKELPIGKNCPSRLCSNYYESQENKRPNAINSSYEKG